MLEPAAPGSRSARAFLRVGGLTVARQQVALALQLGCERVVCIAAGPSPELSELQQLIESDEAQFYLITQARALVGLVSAVDEVIVIADGLFATTSSLAALLEEGQGVLVQPIEQGLAAGFERIDLNHAFGGAMRLPGRIVERMAELPVDCDATSALLRIALQAGVRQKPIPQPDQARVFWTLVRSEDEAHALEPQWIRQRTRGEGDLSFSGALALLAVRSFGPALLHAGSGARFLVVAAAVLILLAIGAGWLGVAALGLGFVALSWIVRESAVMIARIETEQAVLRSGFDQKELFGWILDVLIVALASWGIPAVAGEGWFDRVFAPFMLVALLRILPRLVAQRWSGWFHDRALLALVLGGAMMAEAAEPTVMIAAGLLALGGILVPMGQGKLTRR
ncbi:hypothetical protein [Novosphingobium sp.]|uniref:hypothetical protein n=1 Tax=Novosphingobium sp. TaxID=1874826 RepID=UPI0035B35A1C